MSIKLTERDDDYLELLKNMIRKDVLKTSNWLEPKLKWKYESGMLIPIIKNTPNLIRACIGKLANNHGYGVLITEEFLGWLDDAAEWMNKDVMFKRSLFMSTLDPSKDLSLWMHTNWLGWVINHEFGHFLCGHLSKDNSYEWSEFDVLGELNQDEIELRVACEIDADVHAASVMFGSIHLILQDEKFSTIKENYFFDIGMIFCGMFVAIDHMNPTPSTHPDSITRFMVFMHRGLGEYALHTRKEPIAEHEAFINGAFKSLALLKEDGLKYGQKLKDFDVNKIIGTINLLKKNDFQDKRKIKLRHDWLSSDIPTFYFPKKKFKLWDLNQYPDS
jgi:hypothetical protein